jgi:SnoaL-like domain
LLGPWSTKSAHGPVLRASNKTAIDGIPGIAGIVVEIEMDDEALRASLKRHWDASDASDFKVEHEIYRDDAVLDYPQSGERIRGRNNIQESRCVQPNKKRFTLRRIVGSGELWVTEFVLSYDGVPSYAVSIMEFREGLVAHETQYFADRFEPGTSRAHLVERVSGITSV